MGNEIQTPAVPKKLGRVSTSGIRRRTCRERESMKAGLAFPSA